MDEKSAESKNFPYDIVDLDPKLNEELAKNFSGDIGTPVQVGPQKWFLRENYKPYALEYYNFKVRPDDVWITGFPRSGTTMLQELAWLLVNDLDHEKARSVMSNLRVPFFEGNMYNYGKMKRIPESYLKMLDNLKALEHSAKVINSPLKILNENTERRVMKTHLPFCLLPPELLTRGCKVIFVARNPKDVMVSSSFLKRYSPIQFKGSLEQFFHNFKNNLVTYSPYWQHVKQGWDNRNSKNFLFIFYENLVKDLRTSIQEIADFLDIALTKEQLDELETNLKFDNFKKNRKSSDVAMFNGKGEADFVRRGKIDGWKDYFTPEMTAQFDVWMEENVAEIGIEYP